MARKIMITCAVTGGGAGTRDKNPAVPVTPEEISTSALEAHAAGAAIVHIHVRDPESGAPSMKPELYKEVVKRIREDGTVKVERVTCGVDCGVPINPSNIEAQVQGGLGYGLSAILREEITLTEGEVNQSNFYDYTPLRISDMPQVDVHIVQSTEAPTGIGEPGTPPVGPAVANAVRRATGTIVRELPFSLHGLA